MKIKIPLRRCLFLFVLVLLHTIEAQKHEKKDMTLREMLESETVNFNITWIIQDFSEIDSKEIFSPIVMPDGIEDHSFWLQLYPRGQKLYDYEQFLSIYLNWESWTQKEMRIEFTIQILNYKLQPVISLTDEHIFQSNSSWGFPVFVRRQLLNNPDKHLLDDDTLRIAAQISFLHLPNKCPSFRRSFNNFALTGCYPIKFFNSNMYSDLMLIVKGRSYPAHKVVLASRSPFFARLLKKRGMLIHIKGLNSYAVKEALRFIYEGRVNDIDGLAKEILQVAITFELEDLKSLAEEAIYKIVNGTNALNIYLLAVRLHDFELKDSVAKFLESIDPLVDFTTLDESQRYHKNSISIRLNM